MGHYNNVAALISVYLMAVSSAFMMPIIPSTRTVRQHQDTSFGSCQPFFHLKGGEGDSSSHHILFNSKSDNEEEDKNILQKINSFLDTPILDANNRSDQGLIAEALKSFVRDEPQVAQVTFSAVVVLMFLVGIRVFNAFLYGGF